MRIGLPKEIKDSENRVSITPEGVRQLTQKGHIVNVEHNAGCGSGFSDNAYIEANASITSAESAWNSDLVVKVKEPLDSEYRFLRGQMLFTYFHLAGGELALTETLLNSRTTAIAYETLEDNHGRLPLLAPMSAVAGNMATLMGAYYLARFNGGKGIQLGQVMGRPQGKVLIIGDGVVGQHAARVATGMGAVVQMLGNKAERAEQLQKKISTKINYQLSSKEVISQNLSDTDLLIGAVLSPGKQAPHLVTEEMVKKMQPGSVIVDVSIDQGGCIETSRPTSHSSPTFIKHGIIHYCVTNMPGAYPRTSTLALTEATLPYLTQLADGGIESFINNSGAIKAINTLKGHLCCYEVAEAFSLEKQFKKATELL
ncbi:MAG: alanine dehydrogenase [Gammaproteobacteria bacterium]|nr:MAG: alanine dehydrogenase [Gammaproteobacteria bacterium]